MSSHRAQGILGASVRRAGAVGVLAIAGAAMVPGCQGSGPDRAESVVLPGAAHDEIAWGDIRAILDSRCVSCHAEPGPAAGLDLTLAANVRAETINGSLLTRLNDPDAPMPPNGLLPEATRAMFAAWATAGAMIDENAVSSVWGQSPAENAAAPAVGDEAMSSAGAVIVPFDVGDRPFEFLERMQGHWVGSIDVMGMSMPWFAFDYRAIGPSHVLGLFEGGTMGNLVTSFFLARYRGVETLVARNGGVLNGIYRMSYFVLDSVEERDGATEYRFVDAIGGADVMWMTLTFRGDTLTWDAHTSRMGEQPEPSDHMYFRATRRDETLARQAAEAVGFPTREPLLDLPGGFELPDWGSYGEVTSASYMWQSRTMTAEVMGALANDPVRIEHMTHLSRLTVSFDRPREAERAKLLVYLSQEPLTNEGDRPDPRWDDGPDGVFDTVLLFPEITGKQDEFTFTYLHPGPYYLTVAADLDGNGVPSDGDRFAPSRRVVVEPGAHARVRIDDL